jgi:hypothetical protein
LQVIRAAIRRKSGSGEPPAPTFVSFSLKIFIFLSRSFAWFAVQFLPHAGGKRFLTTKGTEVTKFSDEIAFPRRPFW